MEVLTELLEAESVQSPSSESGYSSTNQEEQQVSTGGGAGGVDLCLVCRAAVATKHVHYGAAAACNSCRAFFRRAAQSGNHAEFACRADGGDGGGSSERCVIRPKSWKSCQKCRFELCLQAGMRVAFVWNLEQRKIRCARGKESRSQTPVTLVQAMPLENPPSEKFTYADLAYLRHVFQQYTFIDTESTVASLTPTDVENYQRSAREGRPFSYEVMESFQAIPERTSHKFVKGSLSLDISSEDLSTLLESNNPILGSWFWSLTNVPSQHPLLHEYMDEYRARLGEMMKDDSSETVERLYAAAHDPECEKLMCSNLMYDLSHSSPWASDAGLEERHRELATRTANHMFRRSRVESEIVFLLTMIIMYLSTDFVDGLRDPEAVSRQQLGFCRLLYNFFKFENGGDTAKANAELGAAVMIGAYARELRSIEDCRLKV